MKNLENILIADPTVYPSDYDDLEFCIEQVLDKDIHDALVQVFSNEDYRDRFLYYPATLEGHHYYNGGLLKHSIEVFEIAKGMAETNPLRSRINMSVLLAGALLHDIGKVNEYYIDSRGHYQKTREYYSTVHQASSASILYESLGIDLINADESFKAIKHIIESHSRFLEWDALVVPRTLEASIVFSADTLSMLLDKESRANYDSQGIGTNNNNDGYDEIFLKFDIPTGM